MRMIDQQAGNITLIMVAVLMTLGLLLLKALHYYQERGRDELRREIKYFEAFNQAESALSWGLMQPWKKNMAKGASWDCQQERTKQWLSCIKHHKSGDFILSGKSEYNLGKQITVYRWVTFTQGTSRIQSRGKGWLDYCPVGKKGFC